MKKFAFAPVLAALAHGMAAAAQPAMPIAPPAPPAPPAPSPEEPDFDVREVRAVFVPLVALPLDMSQPSDPIWVTGDTPKKNVIARLALKPVEAATVEADVGQGKGKSLTLLRAYAGDPTLFETTDDLARSRQRIYCTSASAVEPRATRIFCLIDADADGLAEAKAFGLGEMADKPEQISLLGKAEPLPAPVRYSPAQPAEMKAAFVNCARDHDRPRYRFSLADESGKAPTVADAILGLGVAPPSENPAVVRNQLLSFGYATCEAAEKVKDGESLHPGALPKGSAVARLKELVLQVGPKDAGAPVKLLGLRNPKRLYRLDRGRVLALSDAPTDRQRELAVAQKFNRPVIMTSGTIASAEGPKGVGDTVLTAGFEHGYMGVLRQETKIRTLLSSRSVPAGTVVYGIPMASRVVRTRYGIPTGGFGATAAPDADEVHLVWCLPVEDETKWTATCLPTQEGERYTILKNQNPAFEVRSLQYAVGTTTNEGMAPVDMKPGSFGRPLSYRFRIKALTPTSLTLVQETMFGDQVVYSRDQFVPRLKGKVSGLIFSRGVLSFSDVEGAEDKVAVRVEEPFRPGEDTSVRAGLLDAAVLSKRRQANAPAK